MRQNTATPSRRFNSRIAMTQDVWICWQCNGRDDVSRVRDLSLGGLFLETSSSRAIGTPTKVDFLVGEGQIRADAVVRHVVPGRGLGLKFTAVVEQDRRKFAALMRRLRS
ncbi:MAG TPA: PilZ domain-containing protein [Candidatus Eremiobacteraceae bacterium]|nr:PilZ domain-containing protein [Candidatus Eremiobacteraceae bacterium]